VALTVGELNAILSVDDRAVDPTLRRAENALRASGQRMGDDASASGQRIGDGIVAHARPVRRRGPVRRAGHR
jgi:hypothetical protein